MTERSGIEILEELLSEVKTLRKELKILDQKVAHIANSAKISEIADKVLGTKFEDYARSKPKIVSDAPKSKTQSAAPAHKGIKNFTFESSDAAKIGQVITDRNRNLVQKQTLVSGKMITQVSGKEVALAGLQVKIYDKTDKLVKETKTNKGGTWMSHLPVGQYVANIEGKYKDQDLVPINLRFEVKAGMETLEVK